MKRFVSSLAVLAFAATPLTALAATVSAGEQYSLPSDKVVSGNLYIAAGTATVGGRVTGDVFAGGGTVAISGSVDGDVAVGGGTIQVLGPIGGDVRALGGTLSVNNRVNGDLVVAGGTVNILPGATVTGDVLIAGGQVVIDGLVNGSVKTVGGGLLVNGTVRGTIDSKINDRLEFGPNSVVGGKVMYRAPREATVADGASLNGGIEYTQHAGAGKAPQAIVFVILGVLTGLKLLATLGLAALLVWRWRRHTLEVVSKVRHSFWPSMGRGVAYLILVPIAGMLLLVSIIGTFPGMILLLGFTASLILTKALAGILLGSLIVMVVKKRSVLHVTWGSALGGVIAIQFVGMIPIIGWIISCVMWVAAFGALAHSIQERVSRA